MKKLIMAAAAFFAANAFCGEGVATEDTTTNVYDFAMSVKVPYLKTGVRSYSSQKLKGLMYLVYDESAALADVYAVVTNSKTKVVHELDLTDSSFYHLMGKQTKKADRSTPTLWLAGADDEDPVVLKDESHEKILAIMLAGTGTLKNMKTVTTGCAYCGGVTTTTEYCNLLWSMSGNVVGVMDCQCPDEEDWWHTVQTVLCGVYYVADPASAAMSDKVERKHEASFYGTWSAKFNKKLSDTQVK